MANVVRFDPFSDLFDTHRLRRLFQPMQSEADNELLIDIRLDVSEKDDAYLVKAELPGVKKEDISVKIDGNTVSISAEVKSEQDVKEGGRVIRSERRYGSLFRGFSLAHAIDEEKAVARCENGLLELTLPKKGAPEAKKLAIQ